MFYSRSYRASFLCENKIRANCRSFITLFRARFYGRLFCQRVPDNPLCYSRANNLLLFDQIRQISPTRNAIEIKILLDAISVLAFRVLPEMIDDQGIYFGLVPMSGFAAHWYITCSVVVFSLGSA